MRITDRLLRLAVEQQLHLYRRVRLKVKEYVEQVKAAGFDRLRLVDEGDVADICRLTCLEQNIAIVDQPGIPTLEVRGLGVVGHQPLLQPGEQFEYTSGTALATPVGTMRGSYQMVAEDGTQFDAAIPEFTLSVPRVLH